MGSGEGEGSKVKGENEKQGVEKSREAGRLKVKNRRSGVSKSKIANRQSPINNQQSTIANRQSPINNQQSTIPNRQSEILVTLLTGKSLTISVAESITGGLIGHTITNIPGSSACFMGGVISYSIQAKCDLLGVAKETIDKYGVVSHETAEEMSVGVRQRFKTNIGLSVTGIAGPDGGDGEKPVGTVFMGLADTEKFYSIRYLFYGNRKEIKQKTAETAIENIMRYLNGDPFLPGV